MEANKKIVLYMNDGVPCGEFTGKNAIKEAYNCLQDCKRQDKEMKCKGNEYYFELELETETIIECQEIKIYKRKNKYFCRFILPWELRK